MTMYKYRDIDAKLMSNLQFSELQSDSYSSGFDKLAAWVDSSLEIYRPELSQVCHFVPKNTIASDCLLFIHRLSFRSLAH